MPIHLYLDLLTSSNPVPPIPPHTSPARTLYHSKRLKDPQTEDAFTSALQSNSREKWQKCTSVTGSLRGQAQVRPINKLDEACTNADDQMMLVQHRIGDRVMS